jgi:hypothetical protein
MLQSLDDGLGTHARPAPQPPPVADTAQSKAFVWPTVVSPWLKVPDDQNGEFVKPTDCPAVRW